MEYQKPGGGAGKAGYMQPPQQMMMTHPSATGYTPTMSPKFQDLEFPPHLIVLTEGTRKVGAALLLFRLLFPWGPFAGLFLVYFAFSDKHFRVTQIAMRAGLQPGFDTGGAVLVGFSVVLGLVVTATPFFPAWGFIQWVICVFLVFTMGDGVGTTAFTMAKVGAVSATVHSLCWLLVPAPVFVGSALLWPLLLVVVTIIGFGCGSLWMGVDCCCLSLTGGYYFCFLFSFASFFVYCFVMGASLFLIFGGWVSLITGIPEIGVLLMLLLDIISYTIDAMYWMKASKELLIVPAPIPTNRVAVVYNRPAVVGGQQQFYPQQGGYPAQQQYP